MQRNELLLKLYFARHASKDITLQKIQEHARLLEERLDTYQEIENIIRSYPDSSDTIYLLLTLDCGIWKTRALFEWCDASLETLEGRNGHETDHSTKDVAVFIIGLRIIRLWQ
ncbi:hypothetical protein [Exiguobacterium undae]|uniref:hypothetical protein n=1 Tax=Exiguobacterium undae TaxID=169177 RepID=UPI00384B5D00